MDEVDMMTEDISQQSANDGARRPRRAIAKQILARGQRLRSRAGLLIALSLGLAAVFALLD
jgi:hypothetical protein